MSNAIKCSRCEGCLEEVKTMEYDGIWEKFFRCLNCGWYMSLRILVNRRKLIDLGKEVKPGRPRF